MEMERDVQKYMEMVPEFLSGELEGDERDRFLKAMERWPELAQAVAEEEALRQALRELARESAPDPVALLKRLEERMGGAGEEVGPRPSSSRVGWLETLRALFIRPSLAWGLCGAMALALFLTLHRPAYRTMSLSHQSHSGVQVLNVIFKDAAKVSQVVQLLSRAHANIVGGPGPGGVFRVEVPKGKGAGSIERSRIVEFARPAY